MVAAVYAACSARTPDVLHACRPREEVRLIDDLPTRLFESADYAILERWGTPRPRLLVARARWSPL
jgi:hypothetical protein